MFLYHQSILNTPRFSELIEIAPLPVREIAYHGVVHNCEKFLLAPKIELENKTYEQSKPPNTYRKKRIFRTLDGGPAPGMLLLPFLGKGLGS